jgi:signal peptidase II
MTAGMKTVPRLLLLLAVTLGCVGCDQATKIAARAHLPRYDVVSLLGDTVRLQYIENPGAFLGLGGTLPDHARHALLVVGVAIGVAAIVLFAILRVARPATVLQVTALALVCGGGIGNLIDRIWRDGRVIDFLNVGVGPLRSGIFNVADVALLTGAALLFFASRAAGDDVTPPRAAPPPPASPPTAPA